LKLSLGKPSRPVQDIRVGYLLESAVNTHQTRPVLVAIVLLLLLLIVPGPARATPSVNTFEQRCEREMSPSIHVRAKPPGFIVHNSVSSRVLNTRGSYSRAGEAMMGMTASSTRAEIDIDGPSLVDVTSARECIAPRISVELSYQPLDVYVAREFHPASCSYREVYAHELRHVRIYVDNLPRIEHLVRMELTRRYASQPLYAPRGQGLALLQDQIDNWLRPLIRAELAKVEEQQAALDTRDEVERLSHMCQGEVGNLMGSSF
jgi:hypothetical protein